MKSLMIVCIWLSQTVFAQEPVDPDDLRFEAIAEEGEEELEDDSETLRLSQYLKNPLNINVVSADELYELEILNGIQVENIITYRRLFGKFISKYELQAVPGLDLMTIRKLLPFITLEESDKLNVYSVHEKIMHGDKMMLIRYGQILEKGSAYIITDTTAAKFKGGPSAMQLRFQSNFHNHVQFGFVADKDAGEPLSFSAPSKGFDFYSFHLYLHKFKGFKVLAIGDFTVNMGQGLIHWQSQGYSKSSSVLSIKKQTVMIRPFRSGGEANFHRGIAAIRGYRNWEAGFFISKNKVDANSNNDTITSILAGGMHRTASEIEDRKALGLLTYGGSISYKNEKGKIGINMMRYHFSAYFKKKDQPYNRFALEGNNWSNASLHYDYTYKNIHAFGEAAIDKNHHAAFVQGLLLSVDQKIDISVVYRNLPPQYQSLFSRVFSEGSVPSNERGLYIGVSIRPRYGWRFDLYSDHFSFPFIRFRADKPGMGSEHLVQLTYTPAKKTELYTRFRIETKPMNMTGDMNTTSYPEPVIKKNWRSHISAPINAEFSIRKRVEFSDVQTSVKKSNGFLAFLDLVYNPMMKPLSGFLRLQYFETDDYDARIYAFENGLTYSYSIPMFYETGYRYYITIRNTLPPRFLRRLGIQAKIDASMKWAQTFYPGKTNTGSAVNRINSNKFSDIRLQVVLKWQ